MVLIENSDWAGSDHIYRIILIGPHIRISNGNSNFSFPVFLGFLGIAISSWNFQQRINSINGTGFWKIVSILYYHRMLNVVPMVM